MDELETQAREVLDKANDALEERGWCVGTLYNGHEHCAMGAIGYARWGAEFDTAPDKETMLREDPVTRKATELLANEILQASRRKPIITVPTQPAVDCWDDEFEDAMSTVVEYNDRTSINRMKGNRVWTRFKKFRKARAAEKAKKAPVDHPIEIEHVKAAPVTQKQEELA